MPRALAKKSLAIFAKPKPAPKPKPAAILGDLPQWNLKDLYPSMDSRAFADDLVKAASDCRSFNV
ncbi:MAG: hypothetical protein L0Y60_16385, partial [Beijerinckiaceae bacterium]|nr:hypothetical protein [Beijerinckiaceae bacterium]